MQKELFLTESMIVGTATSSFCSFPRCPTRLQPSEQCRFNPVLNLKASALPSISPEDRRVCECFNLCKELVPYEDAWNWQKRIVRQKKELIQRKEDCPDTLIVLQHQPVYTMGTASSLEFLNFDIKDAPFQVYRTERGGEVTYHGPGQDTRGGDHSCSFLNILDQSFSSQGVNWSLGWKPETGSNWDKSITMDSIPWFSAKCHH